jgi:putative heme-binding domain-containing protein
MIPTPTPTPVTVGRPQLRSRSSATWTAVHGLDRLARQLATGFGICLAALSTFSAEPSASLPTTLPNWRIELVAEAPAVRHPSVVACAPDGRVFVAEDPMDITRPANVAEGRILCRQPDGRWTVFAEGLHAVFGMQYLEGRLYVLHNPKFSVFRDDAGIGRDRLDLIEQTNPNPWALDWNDHVPANFRLGMDGRFYVAVGDKGIYGGVGRDGKRVELHGGGILRLRPDGTELEVFSTGVRNILDVALTSEDDAFTYDNTDENQWMGRVTHMVDGGFYGYPFDFIPQRPYTLWMLADYGAGAATGVTCYLGDALPEAYRDNLFLADFGQRGVRRVRLERDGGTFRAAQDEALFPNPPGDFRPVGMAWADDGRSFYLCDWQHRDVKDQTVAGRLWRIHWTGADTSQPRPEWYLAAAGGQRVTADSAALRSGLGHPAHSVRMAAQRQLAARGSAEGPGLRALLEAGLQTSAEPAALRGALHALWALDALDRGASARETFLRIAAGRQRMLARQALRQLGEAQAREALGVASVRLTDPDPSIRFHAATALGRIGDPGAVPALIRALDDQDLFARHATFSALNRIGRRQPEAWAAIVRGLEEKSARRREAAGFALRDTFDAALVRALAQLVTQRTAPVESRVAAVQALAPLHHQPPAWNGEWWAYHPFRLSPPARTNEWAGTAPVLEALKSALNDRWATVRLAAADGLLGVPGSEAGRLLLERYPVEPDSRVSRAIIAALTASKPEGVGTLVARLIREKSPTAAFPEEQLALIRAARGTEVSTALLQVIRDAANGGASTQAIGLLAELGALDAVPQLSQLAVTGPEPLRLAALTALGRLGGPAASEVLLRQAESSEPSVRRTALQALVPLKLPGAVPLLLKASEVPELRAEAVRGLLELPDVRALDLYLEGLAARQPALRAEHRRALGKVRSAAWPALAPRLSQLPPSVIAELQTVFRGDPVATTGGLFALDAQRPDREAFFEFALANPGDADRGRKLFEDRTGVACINCHRVQGKGQAVGPDLSGAGAQFDRRALAESVLWPSRAVREGYHVVMLELTDGDELSGMIRGETAEVLSVQPATGEPVSIPKSRIRSRQTTPQSLMPEGLETGLSLEEFSDLISYLQSLRSGT